MGLLEKPPDNLALRHLAKAIGVDVKTVQAMARRLGIVLKPYERHYTDERPAKRPRKVITWEDAERLIFALRARGLGKAAPVDPDAEGLCGDE